MQQSQESIIGGTLIKEATIKNKVIKLFQLNGVVSENGKNRTLSRLQRP